MITLHMQPAVAPMSWQDFCTQKPKFSIALDGYVGGGPRFDATGPWANFNHHEDCDRLATRATCAQVHLAIRQGLFTCFRDGRRFPQDGVSPEANVFANDCDQDVCLSWYLLRNHWRVEGTMNAAVNRLVGMEDMLDATAGAYPYPADLPLLGQLAWVFEPYTHARAHGLLDSRDAGTFSLVVEQVCSRIDRHILGDGSSVTLDTRYERLPHDCGPGVVMVREIGQHARTAMFADGIKAFVAVRERKGGGHVYTLGRMSEYIPFDIERALHYLNLTEELLASADAWGGSGTIGGSPRIAGSKLSPVEVAEALVEVRCS